MSKGVDISRIVEPFIKGVEPFINLLNSKDLVKWRREWNIIRLSTFEKYTTLLNKKIKKYYNDIEKDERLKKKKWTELQNHKVKIWQHKKENLGPQQPSSADRLYSRPKSPHAQ